MNALTPAQVREGQISSIPKEVIEAVNRLLVRNMRNGRAMIKQATIIETALRLMHEEHHVLAESSILMVTEKDFYDNGWLDFEPIFRAAGWKVTYDKPGYNETYEAYFKFETGDQA